MKSAWALAILLCIGMPLHAQHRNGDPTNQKAQKTYTEALQQEIQHMSGPAFESFKKADKQDDGHCFNCERKIVKYAVEFRDWKAAENAALSLVGNAHDPQSTAVAEYTLGMVLMSEGTLKHDEGYFAPAHEHFTKALAVYPNFPDAFYADGRALAHLHQDDAAKAQFERFVAMTTPDDPEQQRARRYIEEPELARARMAPAFAVTTLDGRQLSLDDLKGKVVLLDFWATWCGPCRAALPHMRELAQKFQGQPFIILSVSLDEDAAKWKDFVVKNEMTWLQYRDGGFNGPVAHLFDVRAIPQTFTIDSDGVLQDQHIGDASIEGKLKKLIAHAQTAGERQGNKPHS